MRQFKPDHLVLNFQDAVLYGSDLALIESKTAWLNDACIHFYFTVLRTLTDDNNVILFDPSVISFFMHQCVDHDEVEDFVSSTVFPSVGRVFVPINDNMSYDADWQTPFGGSHWTLLLITLSHGNKYEFWHFDSFQNSGNHKAASSVATKLATHFLKLHPSTVNVVQAKTPQQRNGHDCGIHVLAATEAFLSINSDSIDEYVVALEQLVSNSRDLGSNMRQKIAAKVEELLDP
eukprot:Nitzschia sp. Nitz4//scaffold3_size479765//4345//5043//NITZ4_000004-RA/size479765-processed-gene-0.36-mRNA-1//1//CDS//3329550470//2309//frame0